MPIPMIVIPAIELALQIIERAIASGEITLEDVARRTAAAVKAADTSESNLDRAIEDAEGKESTR